MKRLAIKRDENGRCEKYAWPGGYPIYYVCADGGILCPDCVDVERELIDSADECDKQWMVIGQEVNYEDDQLYCDNCGKRIEVTYAEYENRVKKGLEGLSFVSTGVCPACSECQDKYGYCCEHSLAHALNNGSLCDEGYCSSSGCDCCGSILQQILYDAHGRDSEDRIVHFAVCGDCLWYINYGRLDGNTMD